MHLFALGIYRTLYMPYKRSDPGWTYIHIIIYMYIYTYEFVRMGIVRHCSWPNPGNPGAWSLNDMYTKLQTPFPPKRKKHLRYWWILLGAKCALNPWPNFRGVLIQDSLHQPPLPSTGFPCSRFMEIVCLATQIQPNKNTPKQTTYWAESYLGEIECVVIIEYNIITWCFSFVFPSFANWLMQVKKAPFSHCHSKCLILSLKGYRMVTIVFFVEGPGSVSSLAFDRTEGGPWSWNKSSDFMLTRLMYFLEPGDIGCSKKWETFVIKGLDIWPFPKTTPFVVTWNWIPIDPIGTSTTKKEGMLWQMAHSGKQQNGSWRLRRVVQDTAYWVGWTCFFKMHWRCDLTEKQGG